MKYIIKKNIYKIMEKLSQIHDKKRWQILLNQVKQKKTKKIDIYCKKNLI